MRQYVQPRPDNVVDQGRTARPDIGQFRGIDPARPRDRDSGSRFNNDVRTPGFGRYAGLNTLNSNLYRVGPGSRPDWRHRYPWDGYSSRSRYCRPFRNSYYCNSYRPLYSAWYYPNYYPYTYSTVYLYNPYAYGSVYGGGVAYVDPLYASAPPETYIAPSTVASAPTYQQAPSYNYAPTEQGAPAPSQPPAGQADQPGNENLEYRPLTEPGSGTAIGEGNTAFRARRYDEARQSYSRAVLADERDGYAKMLYGVANFAAGDYQLAATAVRRALMTTQELIDYPIDVRTMYPDVMTLHSQMQRLATYLTEHPEDRDAALVLAYMHYSIGEPEPAQAMFKLMSESDTSDQLIGQLHTAATRAAESIKNQQAAPSQAPPPTP